MLEHEFSLLPVGKLDGKFHVPRCQNYSPLAQAQSITAIEDKQMDYLKEK